MCDEVRLVDGGDDFPLLRVWKKGYGYIVRFAYQALELCKSVN
jgi:hypothetical protein